MDPSLIAPELRRTVRISPPLPVNSRLFLRSSRLALVHARTGVQRYAQVTDTYAGHVPVRLYRPHGEPAPAALLWLHGGGYILGHPRQDDRRCAALIRTLGITVVSVDYPLAPDNPFPAPLDDCHTAWMWLHERATELGIDPTRIAIGGNSSGGGLAAALVQRLHDAGAPLPAGQWLNAPMLDDHTAARTDLDMLRHPVWDNRCNRTGWTHYLGTAPGSDIPDYAAASRCRDLTGLPPAWIGVGSIDLFRDEDFAYAQRLRDCDVEVTVDEVPGAPHGFDSWAPRAQLTRDFLGRANAWLAGALGVPSASD